jgi:hypothetical protein
VTVTDRPTAAPRAPMNPTRRTSLIAGVCYLITFVSIPTLLLYRSVKERGYIAGPGPDTPAIIGGILEILVALAGIGTAVVLYPVVKRQHQGAALGFVAVRILEAAMIAAGVVALLSIVSLRQAGVGPDGLVTGQALVAQYNRSFLLSQSLLPALNALLLGSLLYRSRLVPRALPVLGMIGAPLLILSTIGVLSGLWEQVSVTTGLAALPIAVWEFSLGIWLTVKGFKPAPIGVVMSAMMGAL